MRVKSFEGLTGRALKRMQIINVCDGKELQLIECALKKDCSYHATEADREDIAHDFKS